nr:MAG TPA: hypothetical protein [Caudoviricetes sp.]DAX37681.1 MAG TPA: hypothetical protein [Caudoviricetes sp.]
MLKKTGSRYQRGPVFKKKEKYFYVPQSILK